VVVVTTWACGSGVRVETRSDETRIVRHIYHQKCPDFVGNLPERGEINGAPISGGARNDQLRAHFDGLRVQNAVVDQLIGSSDLIARNVEPLSRHRDRRAVGQMTAMGERHSEDAVAGLQESEKYRLIGLGHRHW
jgi:hypothetical protein